MHVASPILILHIRLLKHFPIQNGRGWGSMCSSNCCAPAHMDFHRFGRRSFPYSSLYRSLVLRNPTLLSLGMTGAKPLSFKSRPPQILYGASKTEQIPKWNCPWTEMEIGESRKRTLKVWISKMQNAQKRTQPKIYAELGAQLVFKPSQVCKLHFDIAIW